MNKIIGDFVKVCMDCLDKAIAKKADFEPHYFMTKPDVLFPENRFCSKCGEYFTNPIHLHGRECQCKTCKAKAENA